MSTTSHEDDIQAFLHAQRYGDALDLIVTVFGDRMLRLAVTMIGDRALAEETIQDVMIRIWRALPSFRSQSSLSTWIYTITRNRCLTVLRQRRATQAESLDEPGVRQAAEEARMPVQAAGDVVSMLQALPPVYRQALTLFYFEGRSYEDIALLLDMPMGTVKTNIHRAKKMLAALYGHP